VKKVYKNAEIKGKITDFIVEDGRFSFIGKVEEDGFDLGGKAVFPGLVDIHCHGALGYDVLGDNGHIGEMADYFARNGVTTWYPTTGGSKEDVLRFLNTPLSGCKGANMPGYHLEGPYISPTALGAIASESIKNPDIRDFEGYDNVKLITVAPELDGAIEYISKTKAKVALGHTSADYDLAIRAIEAGASSLTHTFNAMTPLHHRNPGVIGAAIEKDLFVQVICDGVHIHKSVIIALYRIFGKKMMLISDAVSGAGLCDGDYYEYYKQGKHKRIVRNGIIRTEDGALAGSARNLYYGVLTAISFGIPREDAFYMASTAPATYMGINKGRIEVGYDADFLVVNADNSLSSVYIAGEKYE